MDCDDVLTQFWDIINMLASYHDGSHKGITDRLVNPDRPNTRNKVNHLTNT